MTVGSFYAREAENIIPDRAEILINVRNTDTKTRVKVLAALKRIVKAENKASNAPKEALAEQISGFSPTVNNEELTKELSKIFHGYFKDEFDPDIDRVRVWRD